MPKVLTEYQKNPPTQPIAQRQQRTLPLLAERRLGPLHVVDVRLEELGVAVVQLGVLPLHLGLLLVQPRYWKGGKNQA